MAVPAARKAMISACALGSLRAIGWLRPRPMISPARTITAPTGTSPARSAAAASRKLSRIQTSSGCVIGSARSAVRPAVANLDTRGYACWRRTVMLEVGQEVVLMSFPGRFRVIDVEGNVITIENDAGIRKKVLAQAVRVMPAKGS